MPENLKLTRAVYVFEYGLACYNVIFFTDLTSANELNQKAYARVYNGLFTIPLEFTIARANYQCTRNEIFFWPQYTTNRYTIRTVFDIQY